MVDWSLANGNGFQNALATGLQLGQTIRQQRQDEQRNALMMEDRQIRQQQMQAQAQRQQVEQQRADLPTLGKLLKYGKQGPQQWSQALGQAQSLGLDISEVPQQFDPQWADERIGIIDFIATPQGAEALSTAGKQAADMGYRPGTPEFASVVKQIFTASEAKPYVVGGETRLYTPQIGGGGEAQGGIPPGALEALKANPALAPQFKEKYGIDPAQLLGNGGPMQPASGGFPSGL